MMPGRNASQNANVTTRNLDFLIFHFSRLMKLSDESVMKWFLSESSLYRDRELFPLKKELFQITYVCVDIDGMQ